MSVSKKIILVGLATIFVVSSGAASFAASATSKTSLNVRSGPGTNYRVVDSLYRGERVEVGECVSNGWCYITHKGPDGWVSAKYLRAATAPRRPVTPRRSSPSRPHQNPPVNFGFSMDSNGGFSFGLGVGSSPLYPNYPTRPAPTPKVCFYQGEAFSGQRYCVTSGTSMSSLPYRWDDRISSIKLLNGASVKVCRWEDYSGGCRIISSNKRYLGSRFNNRISSFKAF